MRRFVVTWKVQFRFANNPAKPMTQTSSRKKKAAASIAPAAAIPESFPI
jgi:hypothetical protein